MTGILRLRAPSFWFRPPGFFSTLLSPLAYLVGQVAKARRKRPGWQASVPVLCVGNLTVGGTGKTTTVLDLIERLRQRGAVVHCLTRGYRGQAVKDHAPLRVDPVHHTAADVGDEPLLLAAAAPCWVSPDRAASARAAIAAGATCLIMDDGFQNPGLHKDFSFVLVDGAVGFGNRCVLPAGPLREPLSAGLAAANAVVITGEDLCGIQKSLSGRVPYPVLKAELQMEQSVTALRHEKVIAFAGLARPDKFFACLNENGVVPVKCIPFPDHHSFTPSDLAHISSLAAQYSARLVTTPKDAARLPDAFRQKISVVNVGLKWVEMEQLDSILDHLMEQIPRS
ncbi:MAG: tetraacyldisaccharide 4'-kinase [Acetobacter aceti]|uniref:Tetraacyldisaccharide 4'-kinase n=1 Tax=Acetobacter aceti TaxID=435 RepID=A0A1U9KF07_ACEAC|nr:tetraacyldisaccharide 4'-kinase [Acetobacter aceti]AQS84372.1 tetraacyldisaccharide 4'-kinase [Acetobacter aceti]